jgi:hypothetical protein
MGLNTAASQHRDKTEGEQKMFRYGYFPLSQTRKWKICFDQKAAKV